MSTILGNQNASLFISSSKIALQIDESDVISIEHGSGVIDMGGYTINNVVAGGGSGLITQDMGDSRYYQNTTTLDQITAPTSAVAMNAQKISGLADPTNAQDAVTKNYADTTFLSASSTINDMTAPVADFSMNSHKITSLTDPTSAQDAATKNYVDSNFYQSTTTLDQITAPASALSLNSQSITDLADPVNAQDAMTKAYTDSNYYNNTTTLDSITAPTASLDMNAQKITNVAPGTSAGDVLTVGQSTQLAYGVMYTNSNLTSISFPYTVPFASVFKPTAPLGGSDSTSLVEAGSISVTTAGVYKLEASLLLQYSARTDSPAIAKLQRYDSSDQSVAGQTLTNVSVVTNRAPALNTNTYTHISQLVSLNADDRIKLVLSNSDSTLSMVANGSSVSLQLVQAS